jgi:signal transduction histidine kinase
MGDPRNGSPGEQLLAGLIHEMRHPLLGIKAGLELLAMHLGGPVKTTDEWQMIASQVGRLEELFRTYQGVFGADRAQRVPFAVTPVIDRVVELLRYRLAPLGQRFTVEPGSSDVRGYGVPQALQHALTNLLANALDALDGRSAARLAVRILPSRASFVELRISDEGAGIPLPLRDRIFAAGFTTKAQGKGSGLGLHIARTAMAAQGGDLRLVSDGDAQRMPWAKTEFSLLLPRPPGPA